MKPETESSKGKTGTIRRNSLHGHIIDSREPQPVEAASVAEQREAMQAWCDSLAEPLRSVARDALLDEPMNPPRPSFSRTHRTNLTNRAQNLAKIAMARFKSDF
jgi:hypothetical protein